MQSASPSSSPAGISARDGDEQQCEGNANTRDSVAAAAAAAAAIAAAATSASATASSPDSPAARTDGGDPFPTPLLVAAQRKRRPGPGGRGVANLTPEQLAKKRANDREAQRNIRERTKAQIESLERTIEQLKSQQPYQELQRVVREKETLETELAEIKCVLATVLNLIQPHAASSPDGRATTTQTGLHLQGIAAHANLAASSTAPRAGYHHEQFMTHVGSNNGPLSATSTAYSMPWQTQGTDSAALQSHPPPFAPRPRSPNGQPTLLAMASSIYRMTDGEQEALNLLRLGEPREQPVLLQAQRSDDAAPPWARPLLNRKATCTLDTICLTFLADIEKKVGQGVSLDQAVGGNEPDWQFIANPDSGHEHLVGPLSRFFGQVLSNRMFPDLQKPAEKVGTAYLLYANCFWQMTLRREDYERMPPWLRPSRAQLSIHHGPWIDAMFWPEMRDAVLMSPQEYVFDEIFVPLTRTVSCNWPYGDEAIFDTNQPRLRLTDRFLQHIMRLENWTLGLEFALAYPQLKGTFNLRTS